MDDKVTKEPESEPEVICVQESEEVPETLGSKKRRLIHMDAQSCYSLSQRDEGLKALKDPTPLNKKMSEDPNSRLYPVIRRKKSRQTFDNGDSYQSQNAPPNHVSSLGFCGASNMYDISSAKQRIKHYQNPLIKRELKPKVPPRKDVHSDATQSTILQYMKSETCSSASAQVKVEEDEIELGPENRKRSVMYSPIKKVHGTEIIYISDSSPASSPSSSQKSKSSSQVTDIRDNPVVMKLFAAQKNIQASPKKTKQRKPSQRSQSHQSFEIDSFDMTKLFDSDSDNFDGGNSKQKTGKGDKYGLLGSGRYPKTEKSTVNYFELLPFEVLENIFCQLPMLDLCLNSNRVCLAWNSLISNEKFVPWKKLYHKLKLNIGNSRDHVWALMVKHNMTGPHSYLTSSIRYMKNFKPVTANNMLLCLKKHRKYHWVKALIEERFQDCIVHKEPVPWCVITVLVMVADSVYDIREIISCLSVSTSHCTATEIIECLYCIATFLFAFKLAKRDEAWSGMHYRLFYALYLFENASRSRYSDLQGVMSESSGQQSLTKYSDQNSLVCLTHEQLRIVKHQPHPREIIKIVAFAGTGKTTTLVRYTKFRPDKRFLLLVFNKSVCDYAKTKFPRNVTCKTGHGLAFGKVGFQYKNAGKLRNMSVYAVTQALPSRKGDNLFVRAKLVLETVDTFCSSADPFITTAHVRSTTIDDKTGQLREIEHEKKMLYVADAELLWKMMKDLKNKKVGMTHDGYLKLYQLRSPSLTGYDCILIDEAQDITPAIADILVHQPQGKILVGDPHQQIYSFRGAVNSMEQITVDTTFYLTQSFRFGPEIAQAASACLEVLKFVDTKTLVGSGNRGTVLGEAKGQIAIICRCNFTVFSEAVKRCCYSNESCKVAFVGGTENFGFPMLLDIYTLMLLPEDRAKENRTIAHPLVKIFKSFVALDEFASKSFDNELLGKIKIVKTYHNMLPAHIQKISSMCVRDTRQADYVFTTAHKAKGLEFSTVRVTDDFMVTVVHGGGDVQSKDEENLLYVAVTRAKNALQMSPTIFSVLRRAGEQFLFPVLSEPLKEGKNTLTCMQTGEEFSPNVLTLQKKTIKLCDGTVIDGGLISPAILTEDGGSFSELLGQTTEEKRQRLGKETEI